MYLHLKVTKGEKLHLVGSLTRVHMARLLFLARCFLYARSGRSVAVSGKGHSQQRGARRRARSAGQALSEHVAEEPLPAQEEIGV